MADERSFSTKDIERITDYLDADFLDDWKNLDFFARVQINKTMPEAKRALWRIDHRYGALFPFGVDRVERIRDTLLWGFDLLLKEKRLPAEEQFYYLKDLYELAIDIADIKLREAEAIPIITLLMGAASVKTYGLGTQLVKLNEVKRKLYELEGEAMALKVEAQIQQALGFVTNTFTLIVPGLSIFTKGALALGDFLLDNQLGPNKTGIAGEVDDPMKAFNVVLDVLEDTKRTSARTKSFAGKGGKILTVTGFYIDNLEVNQADDFLKKVQQAMKEAKQVYQDLVKEINTEISRVKRLAQFFQSRMAPLRRELADADDAYYSTLDPSNNPESSRFAWRFQTAKAATR